MSFKLIGRKTEFKGKSLWEILGNLKKFGICRTVSRNMFLRYPEYSFMTILKAEALPDIEPSFEKRRKIIALVQKTFRGMKIKKPLQLESVTYKDDYFLIHKYNEFQFFKMIGVPTQRVCADKIEYPPLIKEYISQQIQIKRIPSINQQKMKLIFNQTGKKLNEKTE